MGMSQAKRAHGADSEHAGRGDGMDAFHRYWAMLGRVPRAPGKISTSRLGELLEADGFTVTARTVQRDLEKLAVRFTGLACIKKGRPYQWQWDKGAPGFVVPGMTVEGAVTLELVRQHLSTILPRSSVSALDPLFVAARKTLDAHASAPLAQWPRKVRSLPRGYPRRAPEVSPVVLDGVYQGLLRERVLTLSYQKQGATEPREYTVHPLGLVERSGVLGLVCTLGDHAEVRQLVLHRVRAVTVEESKRKRPRGFDLDAHIAGGNLGYLVGKEIPLALLVTDEFAESLRESAIAADQTLQKKRTTRAGWTELTATVNDSMELRGWLRSLGALVEVTAPKALRASLAEEARAVATMYR